MAIYNPNSNQHSDGSDTICEATTNKQYILDKIEELSSKEYEDGSIICDDLNADLDEIWNLINKLL